LLLSVEVFPIGKEIMVVSIMLASYKKKKKILVVEEEGG
jgi:hypothetical protein